MSTNWIITVSLVASIASVSASSQNFSEDLNHQSIANIRSSKVKSIIDALEATAFSVNYSQNTFRDLRTLTLESAITCGLHYRHASANDKKIIKQHFKNNADEGSAKDQYILGVSLYSAGDIRNGVIYLEQAKSQGFLAANLILDNLNKL